MKKSALSDKKLDNLHFNDYTPTIDYCFTPSVYSIVLF